MNKSDRHYVIGNKNPNFPYHLHPAMRAEVYIFVSNPVPMDENNTVIAGTVFTGIKKTFETSAR